MAVEERKSILVVTLSNIGDVILTTPVIASLRAAFSRPRLTVVVGPKAAGLLQGSRQIDRLLVYDKEAGWPHRLKLLRALREEFYDWVIDLRNSAIPYLVRADRRSPIFRRHHERSTRARHLEVLRMTKLAPQEAAVFDFFSEQDEASLSSKLEGMGTRQPGDFVVLAPGAGSEAKQWRLEGFREVLGRLLDSTPFHFFVVGDSRETFLGDGLSEINPTRVTNLAGAITLRELAALISRARLVLTNDSASMHLAYELRRPVVALFGPTDHEKYGRESEIWRIVQETHLEELSPDRVLRACSELLNGIRVPA